jgi:hypothetical protein
LINFNFTVVVFDEFVVKEIREDEVVVVVVVVELFYYSVSLSVTDLL